MAAIAAVFTITYVAEILGEDPEDGRLYVYGVSEDGATAFTEYGIESLKQIIADERAAGRGRAKIQPTE